MIQQFENRCPLLSGTALEKLRTRGDQRDKQLDDLLKAGARLSEERQEREQATDEVKPGGSESTLSQQKLALRQELIEVAERAAMEGVQEFAAGLLLSQNRLAVHAVLVREYTALLAGEIRDRINASELFRIDPLPLWRQDSIVQMAIHACEEILAGRTAVERPLSTDVAALIGNPTRTWSPLVQEWEVLKSARKIVPGAYERIPESDLRDMIAAHFGGKAEDLTFEEIRQAAFELCLHYGSFQMIPSDRGPVDSKSTEAVSRVGAQFWKEREDEFRKYDTPENTSLGAMGFENGWGFHGGPGPDCSIREAKQLFQALAREAAKGLVGPLSDEPWVDWLNALQRATDKSTGKPLYGNVFTGTNRIGEHWLRRMAERGEPIPAGGVTEYVLITSETSGDPSEPERINNSKVGTRLFWDTTSTTIECLFKTSANYCLELRSLAPQEPTSGMEHIDSSRQLAEIPGAAADDSETAGDMTLSPAKLNVEIISAWMEEEGYDNKLLADALNVSIRTVSSMRNNGDYHGNDALTKLANRMKRSVEDLYLP